jgi:hypothetical protein
MIIVTDVNFKQCRELIVRPTIVVPKQLISSQVEDS